MGAFFIYILKSAVCLVLFYLFFKLLLSRETFHRFNRVALLGVLLFSLLIPCIEVTTRHQVEVQQAVLSIEQLLMMAEMENTTPVEIEAGDWQQAPAPISLSWIQIALLIYLAGIVVLVCRNVYSLLCLFRLICSGKREKLESGITLVVHNRAIAPFSWMRYIVISRKDLEENGREILIHEAAHIRNCHSWDLLIADICIFFQWFNPGAWLLKQELQNIHEYEADETVINEGVNAKDYQLLLIKKAVGTRLYSMANSFNHSKLKKRITMMLKEKSNPWARLKYLYVLPLAAIAVTAFARPEISEKADEISAVKVNDLAAIVEAKVEEITKDVLKDSLKAKPYVVPEKSKMYGGRWVSKDSSTVYSADSVVIFNDSVASKRSSVVLYGGRFERISESNKPLILVDGKEVSKDTLYSIMNDEANPNRIKTVSILRSDAALSIYGEKGKHGVYDIELLPNADNHFRITKTQAKFKTKTGSFPKLNSVPGIGGLPIRGVYDGEEPLVVIDGKEVLEPNALSKISPDRIKSFSVLKSEAALEAYGEKAKNGVILIDLLSEEEYEDIKKNPQRPYNNAWEMAMNIHDNKVVPTGKVLFFIDGKEASEEELKNIPANEVRGVSRIDNSGEGETTIRVETERNSDKWVLASGIVMDKEGKPMEGVTITMYGTSSSTKTDATGHFELKTPKDASLQISRGEKVLFRTKAAKDIKIVLDK
ncbi:M56 family metallopeptidase [Bacteroides thetaiotaomicron]|uniref:Antirepressor regulating drug resistance, predicted signal transduction N-terminal membrane component n=1 Tax=Bacteroides thetaiotaomicron TaxID=818 RepID=A0A174MK54_BACT4|nr:M56 family metallopeptidase [Bacteroides thetaiotaomicron]CUP36772.1 Antirepressor regulating drug resistance%2C predicted signal transduction N-terminal membrane component [Bacteroides thetaiotaomicron]